MIISVLKKIRKEIAWYSPLRKYFFPRYRHMFSAPQLCFMCQAIWQTRNLRGDIAEIGVSGGATTLFLNNYLKSTGIMRTYYAIDTFAGFTKHDVQYEREQRGKTSISFRTGFEVNKKKWFEWTVRKLKNVKVIQADVNKINLRELGPLSFCLLDVDLYRPMKKALPELYNALLPGGIIIVDDCDPSNYRWDGSDQAYKEFMEEI